MPVRSKEFRDQSAGQFVCDFIERLPTTDTGAPFELYAWERSAILEFYSAMVEDEGDIIRRYQYLYLEIPKKNGKTELSAALGLYHLFADGEHKAEIYLCAADRNNAGIIYDAMIAMIDGSPWLSKLKASGEMWVTESTRTIVYQRKEQTKNGNVQWKRLGVLKVMSSDTRKGKHGYKPSCVIFDELHDQPNRKLWDLMTFGSGDARRQPVWIVLTTAGDDPDRNSIGWEVHEKAVGVRDARQLRRILAEGGDPRQVLSLRHVDDEDLAKAEQELLEREKPEWLPVLYGLTALYGDDPEDLAGIDIYDEALWYRVNPSLGHHLKISKLRAEARDARRDPAAEKLFRWLRLNQWISVKAVAWLPLTLYDKCQWGPSRKAEREDALPQLRGKTCYGGVDLSSTTDLTAFCLFFPPQSGLEAGVFLASVWRPEDGTDAAEKRDHVPYRDWARAGFLHLCTGNVIDYADVENTIKQAKADYDLRTVGFDPYLSRTITQRLTPIVRCIEIPQDMKNLSPAMKEIERGMLTHAMLHVHNTCVRWTFGNVRNYADGNGNIRPMKNKSTGRIDPILGWIIAIAVWMILRNQNDFDTTKLGEDWGL